MGILFTHRYIESGPWYPFAVWESSVDAPMAFIHKCQEPILLRVLRVSEHMIIQILYEICSAHIWQMMIRSCHNFAHATTAQLSWHVRYCNMTGSLESQSEQNNNLDYQDFVYELVTLCETVARSYRPSAETIDSSVMTNIIPPSGREARLFAL